MRAISERLLHAMVPPQVLSSRLLLDPGPGVFERESAIEDETARGRVGIEAEVADALELETVF
jgi:hypothetical protein